jgi:hypothetical protein
MLLHLVGFFFMNFTMMRGSMNVNVFEPCLFIKDMEVDKCLQLCC